MELHLLWENEQDKVTVGERDVAIIEKCLKEALKEERFPYPAEVNLLFTDNTGIREMNQQYRETDRETDVLSFPLLEQEDGGVVVYDEDINDGFVSLGDIVISLEKAEQQAREYGHSFEREIGFLAVHSMLHLLGYDHERGETEEKEMFEKQNIILNTVGLVR